MEMEDERLNELKMHVAAGTEVMETDQRRVIRDLLLHLFVGQSVRVSNAYCFNCMSTKVPHRT